MLHGAQSQCVNGHCPTIFPVLGSLAASFNATLWRAVGDVISTEMRALNNLHVGRADCPLSMVGTNGWGPNVNLRRDERWGRSLEVPSEDPMVAGTLGASMIQGLQQGMLNNDSQYVKLLASVKHFTAYSMEDSDGKTRFGFDPQISLRDMAESYLPAFQAAIVNGGYYDLTVVVCSLVSLGVLGMMCSYTSINGTAMCESARWQAS